jgi:hypothetical protein
MTNFALTNVFFTLLFSSRPLILTPGGAPKWIKRIFFVVFLSLFVDLVSSPPTLIRQYIYFYAIMNPTDAKQE